MSTKYTRESLLPKTNIMFSTVISFYRNFLYTVEDCLLLLWGGIFFLGTMFKKFPLTLSSFLVIILIIVFILY